MRLLLIGIDVGYEVDVDGFGYEVDVWLRDYSIVFDFVRG